MIVILSSLRDDHAVAVMRQLDVRGTPHELIDLSEFPRAAALTWRTDRAGNREASAIRNGAHEADLLAATVAWWRRPQPFELHSEILSEAHRFFVQAECHEAVVGALLTMDVFWVNHPMRDEEASRKLYQLRVANECGLEVPVTCVTNDPVEAAGFVERAGHDNVVYKSFTATEDAWRETRLLRKDEFELIEHVKYAPVIFQQFVPADADLRVTIFGREIFPAAVRTSEPAYRYDYRMDLDQAAVEPFDLPPEIRDRLLELMRRLGLVYGAVDMRLTPGGRFVFLEINPSGQWLFMEERTGMPITRRFADFLASNVDAAVAASRVSALP